MGIASFEISTGKPLEFQSDADPETLIVNAVNAGYTADNVETRQLPTIESFLALIPISASPESAAQARLKSAACSIDDIKNYLIERDRLG
jgi:hypothetical protein